MRFARRIRRRTQPCFGLRDHDGRGVEIGDDQNTGIHRNAPTGLPVATARAIIVSRARKEPLQR